MSSKLCFNIYIQIVQIERKKERKKEKHDKFEFVMPLHKWSMSRTYTSIFHLVWVAVHLKFNLQVCSTQIERI